jgi:hypothetical protein
MVASCRRVLTLALEFAEAFLGAVVEVGQRVAMWLSSTDEVGVTVNKLQTTKQTCQRRLAEAGQEVGRIPRDHINYDMLYTEYQEARVLYEKARAQLAIATNIFIAKGGQLNG